MRAAAIAVSLCVGVVAAAPGGAVAAPGGGVGGDGGGAGGVGIGGGGSGVGPGGGDAVDAAAGDASVGGGAAGWIGVGPLVLPRGGVVVDVALEVNAAPRRVGQPLSLAPDVWYGVTEQLTVGVTTSARALSRIDAGDGLCLRSAEHGCPRLYDDLGLDARWRAPTRAVAVALRARLVARSLSPLLPSLRVGALLRWRRAAWGIDADPHLQLGLYHRDLGNRAQLDLPLWVRFALGCRVAGWVRSGVRGELAVVADDLSIPLGLGAAARLGPVDVGVEGAFVRLLGPLNNVAERDLVLFARWRRD